MILLRFFACALLVLALATLAVRADDICGGDQERANATSEARAAIAKAEKAGNQAELFLAYRSAAANDCLAVDLINKARASMGKVGRDLAVKAESKGVLYSSEPVAFTGGQELRANQGASAFAWLEAIGEYPEANRIMLKAVQTKSDNLPLFKAAWSVDQYRYGPRDPKTGDRQPYVSPPAYRQTLERTATANADRLMKAEEKDAQGLSGSAADVAMATMKSLEKLRIAAEWMKFLPGNDKPAKDRAELRGDTIMKRLDPTFTQGNALGYYEFSGTPRAKDKMAQIEKRSQESQRAMEKASDKMKGSFTQKNEADQKQFEKKKADLEKELGF